MTAKTDPITIVYDTSVQTEGAGWRGITVTAKAIPTPSGKMATVVDVDLIDGEPLKYKMSRTGAHRQQFSGFFVANMQIGKKKRLSACLIISTTPGEDR